MIRRIEDGLWSFVMIRRIEDGLWSFVMIRRIEESTAITTARTQYVTYEMIMVVINVS